MKLYYHKTDGGAEYLMDKYITCPNGEKEGIMEGAKRCIRIDGLGITAKDIIKEISKKEAEKKYGIFVKRFSDYRYYLLKNGNVIDDCGDTRFIK